jgi:sensor c-di-GMP phosphodiesterase-like protein
MRALERLRHRGTLVQVDDFGTGFSSLAYLQRLPIDALKLDRSFVAALSMPVGDEGAGAPGERARDREIVSAVVQLARNLRIDVIAEGIEYEGQADFLASVGCGYGQGYGYAPPLAEEDVLAWADARATAPAAWADDARTATTPIP